MSENRSVIHRILRISRFMLPVVIIGAAASVWLTADVKVASGTPGSSDPEVSGLAAAYLSARHADAVADTGRAVAYLDAALRIDPNNTDLLEENYFLAAQMGDFGVAVPAAKKAYDLMPRRGLAPVILAVHHFKRREHDQAWFYINQIPSQSMNAFALPMLRAWGSAPLNTLDDALSELAVLESY
ncbi:MAG: hypothetical protein RLN70_07460, partial [Rhodospirillaceae bacterium]